MDQPDIKCNFMITRTERNLLSQRNLPAQAAERFYVCQLKTERSVCDGKNCIFQRGLLSEDVIINKIIPVIKDQSQLGEPIVHSDGVVEAKEDETEV